LELATIGNLFSEVQALALVITVATNYQHSYVN